MRRVTGSYGYAGNWRSSSRSRALIPAVWGLPAQSESKADCEDTREEKSGEARYFLKTVSASASAYADHQSSSIYAPPSCVGGQISKLITACLTVACLQMASLPSQKPLCSDLILNQAGADI